MGGEVNGGINIEVGDPVDYGNEAKVNEQIDFDNDAIFPFQLEFSDTPLITRGKGIEDFITLNEYDYAPELQVMSGLSLNPTNGHLLGTTEHDSWYEQFMATHFEGSISRQQWHGE